MSYNPARQHGGAPVNPRRQRRLDPRAGIRHSEIIAKHGPAAATVSDVQNRQDTPSGWKSVLFCGDEFEMVYEFICSRNASGGVCHPEKDRALRLMAGELFLTINGEVAHLRAGSSFAIPKGIEYQISTSGTLDAEVLFCQGSDYEEGLEHRSDPEAINAGTMVSVVESDDPHPVRTKTSTEATRRQAEKMAEERRQRDVARRQGLNRVVDEQSTAATSGAEAVTATPRRTPPRGRVLPGQQVQGVNPRPMGAAGFGDDD